MFCTLVFTQKEIADRVGCSVKTVQRAIAELPEDLRETKPSTGLINTEDEQYLWWHFYARGYSKSDIAFLFAVSRQTIIDGLNDVMLERMQQNAAERSANCQANI